MRTTRRNLGFFACLLLNLLLNWEGSLPGILLLLLHLLRGWPAYYGAGALALWLLVVLLQMLLIGWASRCGGRRDAPRENKNPYSVKRRPSDPSE